MSWQELKTLVEVATGLSRDALHIYAALLVQLAIALLSNRPLAHPLPWVCVLLFAVTNEYSDISSDHLLETWEKQAALHDLWNTMLAPSALMLLTRLAPRLAVGPQLPPSRKVHDHEKLNS